MMVWIYPPPSMPVTSQIIILFWQGISLNFTKPSICHCFQVGCTSYMNLNDVSLLVSTSCFGRLVHVTKRQCGFRVFLFVRTRSLYLWKGSLNHPNKVTSRITRKSDLSQPLPPSFWQPNGLQMTVFFTPKWIARILTLMRCMEKPYTRILFVSLYNKRLRDPWNCTLMFQKSGDHQLRGSLSHDLQGFVCFIHPRWCRISSSNSMCASFTIFQSHW